MYFTRSPWWPAFWTERYNGTLAASGLSSPVWRRRPMTDHQPGAVPGAALSLRLVFLSDVPAVRDAGKGEYEEPQCFRGIRSERGDRQRQREERRSRQAAGAQRPDLRAPHIRPQE